MQMLPRITRMKKPRTEITYLIVITLYALFLISCAAKGENPRVSAEKSAIPVAETVATSENLFKQREDVSKLREAIQTLAKARMANTRNFDLEWRAAKFNYFLGTQTEDSAEKKTAFASGRDAGKAAAEIDPAKVEGHFWHAANLGELARLDMISGAMSVGEIRSGMNKAIELDATYQGGSAYDALAQVELATTLTGGSAEKAVEYLKKALAVDKDNANALLHIAQAYLKLDKDGEAKRHLDHLLKVKPNPDYIPEYNRAVGEAKKLLETKF